MKIEKILELKENLASLEKTYPKEFDFLLVDIKMEKELQLLIKLIIWKFNKKVLNNQKFNYLFRIKTKKKNFKILYIK